MIYNDRDIWIGNSYEFYGEYSQFEVDFLKSLVKEGDVCIDVGANIGSITVPLAQKVGKTGLVVALEPQQSVYHALCGNIAVNNLYNVTAFQRAVSNHDNMIWVPAVNYDQPGNFGGVSLEQQSDLRNLGLEGKANPVACLTIDQLRLAKVNLIKIDVEGMELEVLQGAVQTINRYKPYLYVECDREAKVENLVKFIRNMGYDLDTHFTPLYNPNNYFNNSENKFDLPNTRIVSANMFCWDKNKTHIAKEYIDQNPQFFASLQKLGATALSHTLRVKNKDYENYMKGNGIDIGSGKSNLSRYLDRNVRNWDLEDGDAQLMNGINDNEFDFVYSSHCLQHLKDLEEGLQNWCRILKPNGYLFVIVPDWSLYEHCEWPSKFNSDHRCSFSTMVTRAELGRNDHFNIEDDILSILQKNGVELIDVRIEDQGYDYNLPKTFDQTKYRSALAQICLVGKKK